MVVVSLLIPYTGGEVVGRIFKVRTAPVLRRSRERFRTRQEVGITSGTTAIVFWVCQGHCADQLEKYRLQNK
jgi:hypothetical protein